MNSVPAPAARSKSDAPAPAADRPTGDGTAGKPNALHAQRTAALFASQMNRDAVSIFKLAVKLHGMVAAFTDAYTPEETDTIFHAAGCRLAKDFGPDRDKDASWSVYVHRDVSGLEWVLSMFVGSIEGHLLDVEPYDDDADAEPVAVVGEGGAP